ncbi:potassium-transporting ATPase subunit B, partial [Klebsiella pneumoniae]|nr:potassium-transporting ATPase subunit B [Klebsiella pneumoniae]
GKAVEVAGDVDVLLLDKTGTITYGDRQATAFFPLTGVTESELRQAAILTSLADPTPEGKSIVVLAKELGEHIVEPEQAEFIAFNA